MRFAAGLGTWTNVSTVTPIETHGGGSGTGTSIVAPSITPTVPNTMLVAFWSIRDDRGLTIPTSMTQRWQLNSNQSGSKAHQVQTTAATEPFSGTSPTGTRTAVATGSEDNVGQMVALRPISGGEVSVGATWTATPIHHRNRVQAAAVARCGATDGTDDHPADQRHGDRCDGDDRSDLHLPTVRGRQHLDIERDQ